MRRQSRTDAVTHGAVHKHCYVLKRPDAGTARLSPLTVALLVDRTDVIHEGVGRVVNNSARPTPPTAVDTVEKRGA